MNNMLGINELWILLCAFLVFIMQAGFLALETGMTRNKNNIDVAMKNILDFTVTTVVYWIIGFPIMFGVAYFGRLTLLPDLVSTPDMLLLFTFQVMFCGTTVTILSGSIAERTRFNVYIIVTILISAIIYPVFGQWAWSLNADGIEVGWLAQMGFYDFAGSTVVHSVGGWSALAMIILVGARTGRFDEDGQAVPIPQSNLPLVIIGVLLLWFGWFGFNGGSTLAFDDRVLSILFNTLMGGSIGGFGGYLLGIALKRGGDIDLILNGTLSGLVSITAGATVLNAWGMVITASVSVLIYYAVSTLLIRFKLDDVVGAIPVHLGSGIWGTLAVGLFGDLSVIGSGLSRPEQILVQLVGIGVCAIWSFLGVYGVMYFLNRLQPLRVSAEDEYIGLNISEHRARNDLVDLLDVMQDQAINQDLSKRASVEPFTQIGRIANYYNLVIDSLEDAQKALLQSNESLEHKVEEVQQANKRISNANEQIKSFANILSHDLRTPITSVQALIGEIEYELGGLQDIISKTEDTPVMTQEAVNEFIPESLRLISSAIAQMDSLTKQILIVARDEARQYKPQHIAMQPTIQAMVDAQSGILHQRKIAVNVLDMPDVVADDIMIQQVFTNLLSNAIKYLDPSRNGQIEIGGETRDNRVIYYIQDNGLGIPESQADRVFQLFRRVGKHKNIEGNGFGLFYIRNMIQRVGGDIWFNSTENIGTRFYVELPKEALPLVQVSD